MRSETKKAADVRPPPLSLRRLDVDGLAALAVGFHFEADLVAFVQRVHARLFQRGGVNEHVLAAAVRRDESETLCGIEELYGASGGHCRFPRLQCVRECMPRAHLRERITGLQALEERNRPGPAHGQQDRFVVETMESRAAHKRLKCANS